MTNATPGSRAALAAYLLLHHRRMPDTPPKERLLYGLSYDRAIFDRVGLFREDLRAGEDTELAARLGDAFRPVLAREVRTGHLNPGLSPRARARPIRPRSARGACPRSGAGPAAAPLGPGSRTPQRSRRDGADRAHSRPPRAAAPRGGMAAAAAWLPRVYSRGAQGAPGRPFSNPRPGGTRRNVTPRSSVR